MIFLVVIFLRIVKLLVLVVCFCSIWFVLSLGKNFRIVICLVILVRFKVVFIFELLLFIIVIFFFLKRGLL